jgi:hypothetical protein
MEYASARMHYSTGTAAWAVCKQKQHQAINQTVMMAINVLMNPAVLVAAVSEA